MKTFYRLLFLLLLISTHTWAQQRNTEGYISRQIHSRISQGTHFTEKVLFAQGTATAVTNNKIRDVLKDYQILQFDPVAVKALIQSAPAAIELPVQITQGQTVYLQLIRSEGMTENPEVKTPSGTFAAVRGLHYQGIIRGKNISLAAISIFENSISGFISGGDLTGNVIIGNLDIKSENGKLIVYNDKNRIKRPSLGCGTKDENIQLPQSPVSETPTNPATPTATIARVFYETEYDLFQRLGSVSNVEQWVTTLHNQVATIYLNDEIRICLGSIYVWNVEDPYVSFNRFVLINQFNTQAQPHTGDCGALLTTRNLGGSIAYLFYACSGGAAVCQVDDNYLYYPSYPWDYTVHAVAHEFGHVFGSQHTHACVWNGNNTAIDGCFPSEYDGCPRGPIPPPGGGTIMSYCADWDPVAGAPGIKFSNGFGPQPRDRIKNNFATQFTCFAAQCGGVAPACAQPVSLATTNITATSATLNWGAVAGAASYTIELATNSTFATIVQSFPSVSAAPLNITGLVANQQYFWRVRANCSNGNTSIYNSSNFIAVSNTCPPPTYLNGNDAGINSITLKWIPAAGAIGYDLQVASDNAFTNIISTINIPNGTTSSYVYSPVTVGVIYYWRLRSRCSGNTTSSWATSAFLIQCSTPVNLHTTSVGVNFADLAWNGVPGALSYLVEVSTASDFSNIVISQTVSNANPPAFIANGLVPGKQYYWRVRANCAGGNNMMSAVSNFTTECPTPINLQTTDIGGTTATLNWFSAYPVTNYTIEVAANTSFNPVLQTYNNIPGTATSFNISGLTMNTDYCWRIKANCPSVNSVVSSPLCFKTLLIVPITLSYFTLTADCGNNRVRLFWGTTQETNSSHFVVERSVDGLNFMWVKKIPAAGNSSVPRDYQFDDIYPVSGSIKYRVVMVDIDGSSSNSDIKAVQVGCSVAQPVSVACNITMSGVTSICDNGQYYYVLNNIPDYTFINWTLWPSAQTAVTMTREYSAKVKLVRNGSINESLELDAQLSRCNSGGFIRKYILVGTPNLAISSNESVNPCTGVKTHNAWVSVFPGTSAYEYNWYVAGQLYTTGSSATFVLQPGQNVSYSVVYSGPCGISYGYGFAQNGGPPPVEKIVRLTPNPASDKVVISLEKPIDPPPCSKPARSGDLTITRIEVRDKAGILRKTLRVNGNSEVVLQTGALETGIFLLKIYTASGESITSKLQVVH